MKRMIAFALAIAALTGGAFAQQPTGTALIIGRVVDGLDGSSLSNVVVTLTGGSAAPRRVLVDPQGRFVFSGLPAGEFTITSRRTGFLEGAYGRTRPEGDGRPLSLRAGERVTDVLIRMWRFGSISGTVIDDAGEPVAYTRVQVWQRGISAGHWRLLPTRFSAITDDLGRYRVAAMPPGEYALVITSLNSTIPASMLSLAEQVRQGGGGIPIEFMSKGTMGYLSDLYQGFPAVRVGDFLLQTSADRLGSINGDVIEAYPTVWHPSAASPSDASIVTLRAGEDRLAVDIRPTLSRTFKVSGTLIGPDGPVPYMALSLVSARTEAVSAEITSSLALSFVTARTSTDANGAFTFMIVPPGQYILRALTTPPMIAPPAPPPAMLQRADGMTTSVTGASVLPPMISTEPTLWASMPVTVASQDVGGLTVTLQQGIRVTGRVEFEGTREKPAAAALPSIRMSMEPADGRTTALPSAYRAQVDPESRFYTLGLTSGQYILRAESLPAGWTLKSAMVGGRDVSDVPLAIMDREISGLVVTLTDRPTELVGAVRDLQGKPDPDATVLVFPADGSWTNRGASARRLRSARASRTGEFRIVGLPPGDYAVAAINDGSATNWQDPAFLQKLARIATKVSLTEGQSISAPLTTLQVAR